MSAVGNVDVRNQEVEISSAPASQDSVVPVQEACGPDVVPALNLLEVDNKPC